MDKIWSKCQKQLPFSYQSTCNKNYSTSHLSKIVKLRFSFWVFRTFKLKNKEERATNCVQKSGIVFYRD